MIINNKLLIKKINTAIASHNENKENEQISIITNNEILDEELKKLDMLQIDISDIPAEERNIFFQELGNILENMQLNSFFINGELKGEIIQVDTSFISKLNPELKYLEISNIDLSNANANIFSHLKKLEVLNLADNNITNLEITSKIDENVAIDLGNNPIENIKINEIIDIFNKHHQKLAFNGHPFLNTVIFGLIDKEAHLTPFNIPDNMLDEIIYLFNSNEIHVYLGMDQYEKMSKEAEKFKYIDGITIKGTKEITIQFLEENPNIKEIEIVDIEDMKSSPKPYTYSREEFLKIKSKIEEIKQQVIIPDDKDENKEKKIFMQVYKILGQMIDYDYYAISEEGKKDEKLMKDCASLKGGLVDGKAVCAGYANILKNVLDEFGIKARYISAEPDKSNPNYNDNYSERTCLEFRIFRWNRILL